MRNSLTPVRHGARLPPTDINVRGRSLQPFQTNHTGARYRTRFEFLSKLETTLGRGRSTFRPRVYKSYDQGRPRAEEMKNKNKA